MTDQFPAIIVLAPMFGSLIIALVGNRDHRFCLPIVVTSLLISFGAALGVTREVFISGPVDYFMGGWKEPRKESKNGSYDGRWMFVSFNYQLL